MRWQVEIDDFCRNVLERHWPYARQTAIFDTSAPTLNEWTLSAADSHARTFPRRGRGSVSMGHGRDYGGSSPELLACYDPRYVVVENSADLLVRGMGRVCGDLAALGYDAEWEVVSACALGAPHTRERVFVVAYPARERPRQLWRVWSEAERAAQRDVSWPTHEPGCERVVTGLPDRAHRVTALGNAIVPHIAQWIAERIKEADQGD